MSASPILTSFSSAGAVAAPRSDATEGTSVAWHFGDPFGEQRAATTTSAIIDRADRAVLELDGDERMSWLHTISSQFVADLADRRSAENLSLDLRGHVEEHFVLTDVDGVTWIDTEGPHGPGLLDFLTKMVFWAKVTPVDRPDMTVLTVIGPDVRSGTVAELLEIPADAEVYDAGDLPELHHDQEPSGFWRLMPPIGEGRTLPVVDLVIPRSDAASWWKAVVDAGATMSGTWTYEALRAAAVRPRIDVDTDERTIPHEVNWIGGPDEHGAVHVNKGCYRGQETVARVHNLGKSPRQLVLLHLDGSDDHRPATGDPILAGGRSIGRVGTVVDHYEFGPIALALVKRGVPVDTDLAISSEDASVTIPARIDPDSIAADDRIQAGRAAVAKLRGTQSDTAR
ncbi:folate-binding protein YgfZ [Gordonia sp. TBRC 11910]|uniref:Folate-binding protein YgfZ n=1 Tax=Gordonia asplenii TaxID=2725283 RepID=A0A848L0E5_9ACTN|nr:folate-binding protein YgfZ [Gordonia asplenii]NMO04430.1 folate-binding protein YgfZ [Gordonia asplenii]